MTYDEWVASVPTEITNDPLWRMEVYQLALSIIPASRGYKLAERLHNYHSGISSKLDNPPLP